MTLLIGTYTALAMTPDDWQAVASKGYLVEVAIPPKPIDRQAYGVKRRNEAVTAAAEEYRQILLTCPHRRDRVGKLKAIAQKHGIRQNSICTRINRSI